MSDITLISKITILLFIAGSVGIFSWVGVVLYLKRKWLLFLEDVLDDGVRFYSLNFFFSGQGVLQYATVFLSSFHAKRYGMLEKRNKVPQNIQKAFIYAFCWFMVSVALMVASYVIKNFSDI
ncbi:hypothetical protein [Agarivorans sp. DSG3-1]|uniref:hypothetical protein n=1 Tax=Agarivorans sp. DSG3-1 TaxID=3342249 RepID=UPI00398F1B4E